MHTLDPVALAAELISIDSVNPSLVPGAAGEAAIAEFCANWLTDRAFEVTRVGSADRPSIVAIKSGTGGRSLMLNAHLDTVAATPEQLAPANLEAWRIQKRALRARRHSRILQRRFRRDPSKYLAELEARLLRLDLPP